MHPLGAIIIGLIAGWIAGKLMRGRGYGIIADIVLGLIGAIIGNWIFTRLGIETSGRLGFLAMATVGAVLLSALPTYSGPSAISAQFAV